MAPSSTGGGSCGIERPANEACLEGVPEAGKVCTCPEGEREPRINREGVEVCAKCGLPIPETSPDETKE